MKTGLIKMLTISVVAKSKKKGYSINNPLTKKKKLMINGKGQESLLLYKRAKMGLSL